jgi:hypothetical protein
MEMKLDNKNETHWLCPYCVYGHLFRVVKNAEGAPTHTEFLCVELPAGSNDLLSAPKGPGGWDGKYCANFINKQETKTCQFYAIGKSETKLYAYDEYDSRGSGQYFTDDVFMCGRYICSEAEKSAKEKGLNIFLVTITKKNGAHKIEVAET